MGLNWSKWILKEYSVGSFIIVVYRRVGLC